LTTKQHVLDNKAFQETNIGLKKQLFTNMHQSRQAQKKFSRTINNSNNFSNEKWLQTSLEASYDGNCSIISQSPTKHLHDNSQTV